MKKAARDAALVDRGSPPFQHNVIFITYLPVAGETKFLPVFSHFVGKINLFGEKIFSLNAAARIFVYQIPVGDITVFVFLFAPSATVVNYKPAIIDDRPALFGIDERLSV